MKNSKDIAKRWLSKKQQEILDRPCGKDSTQEEWEQLDIARLELETLTAIINAARAGNVDAATWLEEREFISLPGVKDKITVTEEGLRMGTRIERLKS